LERIRIGKFLNAHKIVDNWYKRESIKDVRSQGRGVLQMWTSALFSTKNFGFFEIYGVSARTRGRVVEPVRRFFGQGGVNFSRFCADFFYGRPI